MSQKGVESWEKGIGNQKDKNETKEMFLELL
jgi:hypothetical protein